MIALHLFDYGETAKCFSVASECPKGRTNEKGRCGNNSWAKTFLEKQTITPVEEVKNVKDEI